MIKKIKGRERVHLIGCNMQYIYKTEFHIGEYAWRWNPMLKSFIYKETNRIHLIRIPAFLTVISQALKLITEVMRLRGKVLIVANSLVNGRVIDTLLKKSRQPAIRTRYYAGGVTRRKENIRQYLEIQKGLTNVKVKSKYLSQLVGVKGLIRKPAYILILDAVQGQYLLNECQVLGIQTIGCGDTTLNLPKITYPLIGNFKSREKRSALLLLMYHAMFEGMRQETSIFVEYYNKYTRINTEVRNLLKKKGIRETYEQKIMKNYQQRRTRK
uniref:Ribosomal protein S2 n=1 Tax=Dictyostelium citrinum TaxID=361072 RepID=B2VQ41_DICCI|nr:ribosomal protein S2 [Dictyostelium citrinum]ACD12711.1 ribosomal protein S2 [Dictyostelium citrinum]